MSGFKDVATEFLVAAVAPAQPEIAVRPSGPPPTSVPAQSPAALPAAPVELPAFLNELLLAGQMKLPGASANDDNLQSWQGRNVTSQNTRLRTGLKATASNLPQVTDPFCSTERGWCCRSFNFRKDRVIFVVYGCAKHETLCHCLLPPYSHNNLPASDNAQIFGCSATLGVLSCGFQR